MILLCFRYFHALELTKLDPVVIHFIFPFKGKNTSNNQLWVMVEWFIKSTFYSTFRILAAAISSGFVNICVFNGGHLLCQQKVKCKQWLKTQVIESNTFFALDSCLAIRSHSIPLETSPAHIPQTPNTYFLSVDTSQARATSQSEQLSHIKSPCPRVQQALEEVDVYAVGHQTPFSFLFFLGTVLIFHYKLSLRCEHCIFYIHHSSLAN